MSMEMKLENNDEAFLRSTFLHSVILVMQELTRDDASSSSQPLARNL